MVTVFVSEAKCLRDEDILQTLPVGTTASFYFSDLGPQLTWGTVSPPVHRHTTFGFSVVCQVMNTLLCNASALGFKYTLKTHNCIRRKDIILMFAQLAFGYDSATAGLFLIC